VTWKRPAAAAATDARAPRPRLAGAQPPCIEAPIIEHWLAFVVAHVVMIIQVMALLVVTFGTLQAFAHSLRAMFRPSPGGRDFHDGYIRFGRWLIAGLTFQLAADIVQTAFAPSWDELGKLAAIAAIRAFISYFLEHDLAHQEARRAAQASPPDRSADAGPGAGGPSSSAIEHPMEQAT